MLTRTFMLVLLLCSGIAMGQGAAQPTQPAAKPQATQPAGPRLPGGFKEGVHWATRLGMRTQFIRGMCPISKKVVLVPDAATYLDEVTKWTRYDRWPVLYEDSFYAPMFIRRFEPDAVYRRTSVGKLPDDHAERRSMVEKAIALSWRKTESTATTPEQAYAERRYEPVGVVATSMSDPAWTAAVALAAAHGQLIVWLEDDWGEPNDILSERRTRELIKEVNRLVDSTGDSWDTIGDALELLTICRALPARCEFETNQIPEGMPPAAFAGPRAITDCLGRTLDGARWGFTGWIYGGQRASAYVAMCSYFLPRSSVWLGNTYPDEGQWGVYGLAETNRLDTMFEYDVSYHDELSLPELQALTSGGLTADMVMMTSKGNADFFDLGADRASPYEVPLLNTPALLYMLHSWSMKTPADANTVGGRWLRNGAYGYAGSSHEPLLAGFISPTEFTRRALGGIPFGAAIRYWPGQSPFSMPWRINFYGDPFMKCAAPARMRRPFADPTEDVDPDLQDLNVAATAAMDAATANPSDASFAEAIRLQTLLGNDVMAVSLWNRAGGDKVAGPLAAEAALGALFRQQKQTAFAAAFERLKRVTSRERDMLWSLLGQAVMQPGGHEYAELLDRNVRKQFPSSDMRRLGPALQRVQSGSYVNSRLKELERTAANQRERKALVELQSRYR
jgi:hypothetical protein